MGAQRDKAERLRALHRRPGVLVLANAWDVASARVVARLPGCEALATTSAGVAAVLGYPDGERVPPGEMLGMVARIVRAVELPVTADLEGGYGDPAATAEAAIAAGAVGLNIEDASDEAPPLAALDEQVERIAAVREAGERAGVPLVVNARTDVYLAGLDGPFELAVERANAYLAAGADCAFVPGVRDAETIGRLVAALDGPLNVLAGPGAPPVAELARLGVRRVSIGSGLSRAALSAGERGARELLGRGTYSFLDGALTHDEVNELLA